jgi:hypothetical protein
LTLEAAKAFKEIKPESGNFNFVFVSGTGVTREPGFFTSLFSRVKGETEKELMELQKTHPHFRTIVIRPAFVDPKDHEELKPWVSLPAGLLGVAATLGGPIFRSAWKGLHSPTGPLGTFLAGLATGAWDKELKGDGIEVSGGSATVSNPGFRRLMGL